MISFEKDSEIIWRERDNLVKEMCQRRSVQVIEKVSHTMYDPDEIFNINNDEPPNTCESLRESCYRIGFPEKPVPKPDLNFISTHLVSALDLYNPKEHKVSIKYICRNIHLTIFFFDKVPDITTFPNIKPECPEQENSPFIGGETRALELFKIRLEYEKESFKDGKINPNLSKPILFTKEISLSPYLRFGCLSVRKMYWGLRKSFVKVRLGSLGRV